MPTDSLSHVQNLLRQIIQHIHDLKDLFFELTEANHPRLLLEKEPNYVIDKLQNFRQNFNGIMKELKFVESDPCPIEDVQIKIDDLADTEDIINCLHKLIDIVPNEEDKNTYKSRLTFYEETRKKYKEEEEKAKQQLNEQNRIMTQEEINSEFTELSKYSLEYNDFELHKKIGFGAFAEVFLGYQKSTHKIVAIKKLHSNQFNRKNFEMFKREIKIIASVQHFAILPFVGACIKPPYCIITEYLSGGCLFERLRKGPPLDPTKHTIIALGIAAGMAHMHEKGMIHRDLKSLNILLDADDFPKICDFGMSREIAKEGEPPMSGSVGTVQWMAPEVIQCTAYGAKADVYSYGIILWELLTHDLPFQGLKEVQVAMTVINRDSRPIIPQSCPPKLSVLIKLCWDKDPSKRPDFTKIVQAFASGEVFYPGTNHEIVKAYLNQYMQTNTKTYHFNPEDATIESAQQIYDELSNNTKQEEGISKILLIKDYEKWYKYFLQLKIVEKLIDIMTKCQQVNFSFSLVLCLVELLQNKEIIQQFIECNGSNVLLDLFLKFGMTSMNRIIECLMIIIQNDKNVKLGIDHFTKLAPFLVSNDLIIRLDTMKLLVYVLENHVYDEDGSLTVLTLNVMCNAQPEAKPQILMITLKILKLLLELPKPFSFIIRADGPATIYVLLGKDKSEEIQIESLELIQKMLQNSVPPIKTISLFVYEKETKLRAFNAIHRILIVSEACEKIVDENLVKSLIEKCEKACDGEYAQIAYEILEAIAENNVGKKELEKSKVRTKLEDGLEKMIATDPLRPVFMRLYARMGI
ncbi:TKL family protein kinase [Histomonas meleagridis]|uniref:TKL family protein kinase n=1 Tax=Histomonas meleagridis TaxID=135588 RepID=UPI003559ED12|nr:TKL family protein kinase [Histomonas meleagridis]KAH0805458.1 TKL family protein kinase [Histomonas meleagridis]